MPLRRVGRPGLLGTVARTAVVAGTASATASAVQRHQQGRAEHQHEAQQQAAQAQAAQAQAAQGAPQQQAATTSGGADLLDQLERLGQLRASGVLDDAEFAQAKARLLA
ncbi:SHOCT domain-containing protein [Oerskovia sp. Sa1BUA8]|uniref:SHOCT domain-containing protein n=1 Tax=Oerskovia douganii TaxID=2762210 RepID=A0A9D5U805_9CELL|nr:SHOCT domain-containing protein [Oerskovia douganii]MBE7699883.1 SHOCT domain-containing protein [Oerskovia douganii]